MEQLLSLSYTVQKDPRSRNQVFDCTTVENNIHTLLTYHLLTTEATIFIIRKACLMFSSFTDIH